MAVTYRKTPHPLETLLMRAHADKIRKVRELTRWRVRKVLSLLPARPATLATASALAPKRVAYLFTGTYGDFVQCLPALRRLAAAYPKCDYVLVGAERYAREFASELPRSLRLGKPHEPWSWVFSRADYLFTNAVGVFRGSFDLAARLCARNAYGFRHSHEERRGWYSRTIKLDPDLTSFAAENMNLLDLAQVKELWGVGAGPGSGCHAPADAALVMSPAEPWGRGRILFHIGSAGVKAQFGLGTYSRIIMDILSRIEDHHVEVLMGPGDEDVAKLIKSSTRFTPQLYPISKVIRMIRSFEGSVLCFNSFLAHLCHYLGKPAVVLHKDAVPYGYDCSAIHRQVVLSGKRGWDVREVFDAMGFSVEGVSPFPTLR